MQYTVASLEANHEDGEWEVTKETALGTIDITPEVFETDQVLVDVLIAAQYIPASTTLEETYFMGHDFSYLSLHDDVTDRPLFALILEH